MGKLLKGKMSISELHFSDRQLFAEGISFDAADSSFAFDVTGLRVQFNLTSFIFSGFKTTRLLKEIDIYRPFVRYQYRYKPSIPKPSKPLILPDIAKYFKSLRVRDGSAMVDISLPLQIINFGNLQINEELHKINLNLVNKTDSRITLSAISAKKGKLTATGSLNKGRIAFVNMELGSFRPLFISHPDVQDFSSELSLVGSIKQDTLGAVISYEAEAQIWQTQCLFTGETAVSIPYLYAQIKGDKLSAKLSKSSVGTSSIEAEVQISELGPKLNFDKVSINAAIDLAMVNPDLRGIVNTSISGSGTIKDPTISLIAYSPEVQFQSHIVQNLDLNADMQNQELLFSLPGLQYQNQSASVQGSFNPYILSLDAHLETTHLENQISQYKADGDIDVHAEFMGKLPFVDAKINHISFSGFGATLSDVSGYAKLVPVSEDNNLYLDAKLKGDQGFSLEVVGDLIDRNLLIDASFDKLYVSGIFYHPELNKLDPAISGKINAIMRGNTITAHTDLDIKIEAPVTYTTKLDAVGSFDISTLEGALHLNFVNGLMNEQPLDISVAITMKDHQIYLQGMHVNDFISLSGRLNLKNFEDMDFSVSLWNIGFLDIIRFYPDLDISLPEFTDLNLFASYNQDGNGRLEAQLNLAEVDLLAVKPLGINLSLSGTLTGIVVAGIIASPTQRIMELAGKVSLKPQIDIKMDALFSNLEVQNVVLDSPMSGTLNGKAGIVLKDLEGDNLNMELAADLTASDITVADLHIDTARLKATQFSNKLQLDSLFVLSKHLIEVSGSGAIGYNTITREYFESTDQLNLRIHGQLFTWLKDLTSYIEESKGNSSLSFSIGTYEDQFMISGGSLDISDGYMRLKDQSDAMKNINIKGSFDKNRLIIERGQLEMGDGKLVFNNIFEAENSDHFILGFLDLGIMRVMIEEPGIEANVPMFTTPKALTNIVLKGLGSRYATVRGPFDQMKITGEVVLSNTNALFPPNTNNLLKLANSVRESTTRRNEVETIPLPFSLDVLVTLGNNVRYVTYPANLSIEPGGSLHLTYDGLTFSVQEAYFSSERGSIDIFGTVFQVENVDIVMIESQELLSVDGIFYKRAPDGTMITLRITTSPDLNKSFSDRLELSLTSDNPEDRTISQILSRLRYSGSNEPNQGKQSEQLQDEALNLISGNLDASLLTPFLSPVESFVRHKLKLDNFSINAGFIQNIYTQYSADSSQLSDYTDMREFSSNIAQFSSAILLNNLSISMSKYLGRRLFLDYELELQEATDLQKRTRLMVSHGTSIRALLPKKLRLSYTFKYTPIDKELSHEIFLQRSFRFWGL